MKIISFSVKNFRSISQANNLPLSSLSVLVGANNEGKSNILKSLAISLRILEQGAGKVPIRVRRTSYTTSDQAINYEWTRDYPISLQKEKPDGRSEITLEFELSEKDRDDFKKIVGSTLSTSLKIRVGFGMDDAKVEVLLKGPGKQYLTDRLEKIAKFLAKKIQIQYIPAIRTEDLSRAAVDTMLNNELGILERDTEYQELIKKITELQKPILTKISKELSKTIQQFIPDVKSIRVETASRLRGAIRNAFSVHVNDGVDTELETKGDGIKSLIAISLLRHVNYQHDDGKLLVMAIEEPESHLHPMAVHKLREVLYEIAEHHQLILTTHSPILVNRRAPEENILVQAGNASKAKNLTEIRECLGIHVSDNLATAKLILLVEGVNDKTIMETWLRDISSILSKAINMGDIVIQSLNGASKLNYRIGIYRSLLCNIHVFLDADPTGRETIKSAKKNLLITDKEYHLATAPNMKSSEIEDLIDPSCYLSKLNTDFAVSLHPHQLKSNTRWSDKISRLFHEQGKECDEDTLKAIKQLVSHQVKLKGSSTSLLHRGSVEQLAISLENKLAELG